MHFKEVRLLFLLIREFIRYWFDKNFVEAVTEIYFKNQVLFGGIVVPERSQHGMLSNFISNSGDVLFLSKLIFSKTRSRF